MFVNCRIGKSLKPDRSLPNSVMEANLTHLTMGSSGGSPDRGRPRLRILSRRAVLVTTLQALVSLAACTVPRPESVVGPEPLIGPAPSPVAPSPVAPLSGGGQGGACLASLPTVVPPTPIPYPGYAQQEPDTGLHVTSNALHVDLAGYRLKRVRVGRSAAQSQL